MIQTDRPLAGIDTLILAGGLGTRLREAIPNRPKILAPVDGRSFLDYLLEWLVGFGVENVVLSLGHLANQVIEHVTDNTPNGMKIVTLCEPEPLGTAGAIRYSITSLKSETVMIMNGDSLVDTDLGAFLANHKASKAKATLLCTQVHDCSRYGTVSVDGDGFIIKFQEKVPKIDKPGLISAGIYLMEQPMLQAIELTPGPSLENDVFPNLASHMLSSYKGEFDFIDIGTPESLDLAQDYIRRHFS